MKIKQIWDLHYKDFLVEIDGTDEEIKKFQNVLAENYSDKKFLILTERGFK